MRFKNLRRHSSLQTLGILVAASLLSGCNYFYHPWYLLEVDAQRSASPASTPEVTIDKAAPVPRSVRIALLAPDSCEQGGAATSSGEATTNRVVIQIDCGQILGDIEREIVRRGWPAISWKSIDQAVDSGRATSAIEAASKLGATVLLQINALENSQNAPTAHGHKSLTIRSSNHRGEFGPPISVRTERRDALARAAEPLISSLSSELRLGAFLDVTAILVESGRAAWFYKWSHLDEIRASEVSAMGLFLCHRKILSRCLPRGFKKERQQATWAPAINESIIELGGPNDDQAILAAAKLLLDETTADMLDRLSSWLEQ